MIGRNHLEILVQVLDVVMTLLEKLILSVISLGSSNSKEFIVRNTTRTLTREWHGIHLITDDEMSNVPCLCCWPYPSFSG
jgi:hypothetical protein